MQRLFADLLREVIQTAPVQQFHKDEAKTIKTSGLNKMMTSRERLLTALNNRKPDRLPCQVHGWQNYYLKHYLNGIDWYQAYAVFDMDYAIYASPEYRYSSESLTDWRVKRIDRGVDCDGNHQWEQFITTPRGILHEAGAYNEITGWHTEYIIKSIEDFELWNTYYPIPSGIDFALLRRTKERLGDKGIIRSHPFSPGQGSPWQSFCMLIGTEKAIFTGMDEPSSLKHILDEILNKTLTVSRMWEGTPADMVEVGGGAGSSTVISPDFYREFGLKYDQRQNRVFHEIGLKVVNHFCGGLMPMLDLVVESGADGLETMTPRSMGGDCDLKEASVKVGDKLFFIGGFDQNAGFERGNPGLVRRMVHECFESAKNHGGYIIAPSDHFFTGNPENLKAFADACKECLY